MFNKFYCRAFLAALALVAASSQSLAQTIDTTPSWNGATGQSYWGELTTPTYGQVITPASGGSLTSFTFYLTRWSGAPINYQAHIYSWDSVNARITGSALFSSGIMVTPSTPQPTYVPVTTNTGGVSLAAGQKYALFFTTSGVTNPTGVTLYRFGSLNVASYSGGQFVYNNNDDFGALSTTFWAVSLDDLAFVATFAPPGVSLAGLNHNQTTIGEHANAVIATGTAAFDPLTTALTGLPTQAALAGALDQLSPEIYNEQKIDSLFAAEQFTNDLMSCHVANGEGASVIREGQCVWARARARFLDLDRTADNIGAESTVGSFSAGGQVALGPDWRIGFAAAYETTSLSTSTGASADGDRADIGAVAMYNRGPVLLAGSVAGGFGTYETTRSMAFNGFSGTATADSDVDYFSARLHASYLFNQGGWYVKPLVDGTVTVLELSGLTEKGGNSATLAVAGGSDTLFSIQPAVEIGGEIGTGALSVLRPFVRAGITLRDGDSLGLGSRFAIAPAATPGFVINTALDDVLADVGAGVELINKEGAVLRLQYDGRFGEETQQNSASFKGSVPF